MLFPEKPSFVEINLALVIYERLLVRAVVIV